MAYQPINLGTRGNNQTGDDLNTGGDKINDNFQELYTTKLEGITGGTGITIDNTDPLNPVINGSALVTTTSDLTNDGSDGTSTYVENDELGALALLDTVDTAQIDNAAITLSKMANASAFSIIGNNTGSSATPLYLSTSQVRTLLNVEDGAAADQTLSISGNDLTISGGNTVTLPSSGGGVTLDAVPTDGSTSNGVTSNGIYDSLVNINAFVATGNIQADKIQDGSGSGLDADTLDGIDSFSFVQIDSITANDGQLTILSDNTNSKGLRLRNSTTGQSSFFWMDDSDLLNIENSNTGARDVHINRNGSGSLRVNGNLVWNSGNDGPGSTLNADLLDGIQGSQYLRSDISDTYSGDLTVSNGSQIRFGTTGSGGTGLKIQHNTSNAVWFDMGLDLHFRDYSTLLNKITFERTSGDISTVGSISVADQAYGLSWNGSLEVPTKNSVYDKIESLSAPNLATVLGSGNSAGSFSINMSGQPITNVSNISASGTIATSGNITVADDNYDSGWNGSTQVPTKNAVYDKIESLTGNYTSYVARLQQTSTSAPTVNAIFENTTGVTWTWTRSTTGVYRATPSGGVVPSTDCVAFVQQDRGTIDDSEIRVAYTSTYIQVATKNSGGTLADSLMNIRLEIRVY